MYRASFLISVEIHTILCYVELFQERTFLYLMMSFYVLRILSQQNNEMYILRTKPKGRSSHRHLHKE